MFKVAVGNTGKEVESIQEALDFFKKEIPSLDFAEKFSSAVPTTFEKVSTFIIERQENHRDFQTPAGEPSWASKQATNADVVFSQKIGGVNIEISLDWKLCKKIANRVCNPQQIHFYSIRKVLAPEYTFNKY